jgi:hypothetical protein
MVTGGSQFVQLLSRIRSAGHDLGSDSFGRNRATTSSPSSSEVATNPSLEYRRDATRFVGTTELWNPTFIGEVGTFLAQQGGEPKLEVLARFEKDGLKVSRYRLKFAFARALFEVARNEEVKIAYLLIHPV